MVAKPKYKVIKKDSKFEIREYDSFITAEVRIEAQDHMMAINQGFRVLANYIFGGNKSSKKIAMTAPVMVKGSKTYTVSFIMPKKYTLKTLPTPNNKDIKLKNNPKARYAVIRFKGSFKQKNFKEHEKKLSSWLKKKKVKTQGNFIYAGYNAPLTPSFLRRNEVLIKIKNI